MREELRRQERLPLLDAEVVVELLGRAEALGLRAEDALQASEAFFGGLDSSRPSDAFELHGRRVGGVLQRQEKGQRERSHAF